MPLSNGRCGRWRNHRQVIDGILHRVPTRVQWRDLPERFGPWKTVHEEHRLCSSVARALPAAAPTPSRATRLTRAQLRGRRTQHDDRYLGPRQWSLRMAFGRDHRRPANCSQDAAKLTPGRPDAP
ncbi:transposase [Streptomyces sp. NPDC059837]|uniref:transposase n=1 Tax=unclassified Streptomyces TaxID=2593676 RepID=UPI00365DC04B